MRPITISIILVVLLASLGTVAHAQSACYGPYGLPDGRVVNTCGSTTFTWDMARIVVRTWAVPQNSPNGQVEKLYLNARIWQNLNNVCRATTNVDLSCAFCSDTEPYGGATLTLPGGGNRYEISRHRLGHNGAQNNSVNPPTPPGQFFTMVNNYGFSTYFRQLWRGDLAMTTLTCSNIIYP